MKKIIFILFTLFSVQLSAQIEQPRIKFNQVIKDSTGSGRIVISSLTDSSMIYSPDFYINTVDSLLILFGDTVQAGSAVDAAQVRDIIFATIDAGLGVEIDTSSQLGILTIQSLSIEDSVYNGTASLIAKGTPLYVVDIQGNYWSVAPAQANDPTKMPVVAIAGEDIAAGQQGLGLLKGHIKGVNTELFAAGDEVWVDATGGYTNVRPKGEDVLVQKLGTVVKANANGSGIINLGEVQYNLNPNNIFIGGADSLQTTANLPTVLSDSLNNYVTIAGTETITGAKTFTSDLNVDAKIALNAGDDNVVIGDGAGASLVSGQGVQNLLIGTSVGAAIDSGDYNVANGNQALFLTTKGSYNIANGYQALFANTTGNGNIANGVQALRSNTTGIYNMANGYLALYKNISGNYNIANGYIALYNLESGNHNIANGYVSLYNLNSGSDNQAYGYQAGRFYGSGSSALTTANGSLFIGSNTKASANGNSNEIVIGTSAIGNGSNSVTIGASTNTKNILYGNLGLGTTTPSEKLDVVGNVEVDGKIALNDGGNSVFIGDDAGRVDNGSDRRNVGIGHQALYNNTTGYYNVANGYQALYSNTTGYINTANGYQALNSNTTGNSNVVNGFRALYYNTTGGNNIANGAYALRSNTTGGSNIANGYQALYSNTTGSNNVANGAYALYYNTTGNENVANGSLALYSLNSGSNNQAYGYEAGRYLSDGSTPLTTANGSLFIGSNTKALANNSTNEIVIGTNAIGNGSNTITIGSSTTQSLHTRNYEFDIDQTVDGATDNYVLTYDSLDGQISLEPRVESAAFQQQFTAGGTSYTVTTADLPVDINNILVFQNGQVLDKTMFTKSGNTITLNFQPEVGDRIVVMWFKGDIVDIGGNYVTLDQPETITGAKTFTDTVVLQTYDEGVLSVNASGTVKTEPTFRNLSLGEGYADVAKEYHYSDGKTVYPSELGYNFAELLQADVLSKTSLILTPTAIDTGVVASQKPLSSDGDFTFTRSTSATRVNENGYIEKETQNLLTYSNDFSNSAWNKVRSSLTSGVADPFGGSNAWSFLTDNTADQQHYIYQVISQSGVGTFSLYAKANGYNWIRLRLPSEDAYFDLANGVIGSSSSGISASMTDVGNGWYRCEVAISDMSTHPNVFIHITEGDGDIFINGTPSGTDGVYIYAAQLEQGLVARDYIETTTSAVYGGVTINVPRIDYTDKTPSLLLEPQRTNLSIQSEYITGSVAPLSIQGAGMTISYNETTSPEGVDNAMKWTEASNNGLHWGGLNLAGTSVGDDLTISIFAKRGTSDDRDIIINIYDGATSDRAKYNLDAGTIVTDGAASNQPVVSMEDYGNGWWRCIYTRNLANSGYNAVVGLVNGTAPSWQGNGTSNIYTYGLQYEVGSYPTSYIPTYGTAVTRTADFSDNNDIVSSPISFGANDDFTLFYEGSFKDLSSTSNMLMGGGNKSVGNAYKNYWWVQSPTTISITGDSEVLMATASTSLSDNTNYKLLVKREGSTIDFFVDGIKLTTTQSNPNTAFVIRSLGWSYTNSYYKVSGNIKQALVFNQALTDAQCIALTKQ